MNSEKLRNLGRTITRVVGIPALLFLMSEQATAQHSDQTPPAAQTTETDESNRLYLPLISNELLQFQTRYDVSTVQQLHAALLEIRHFRAEGRTEKVEIHMAAGEYEFFTFTNETATNQQSLHSADSGNENAHSFTAQVGLSLPNNVDLIGELDEQGNQATRLTFDADAGIKIAIYSKTTSVTLRNLYLKLDGTQPIPFPQGQTWREAGNAAVVYIEGKGVLGSMDLSNHQTSATLDNVSIEINPALILEQQDIESAMPVNAIATKLVNSVTVQDTQIANNAFDGIAAHDVESLRVTDSFVWRADSIDPEYVGAGVAAIIPPDAALTPSLYINKLDIRGMTKGIGIFPRTDIMGDEALPDASPVVDVSIDTVNARRQPTDPNMQWMMFFGTRFTGELRNVYLHNGAADQFFSGAGATGPVTLENMTIITDRDSYGEPLHGGNSVVDHSLLTYSELTTKNVAVIFRSPPLQGELIRYKRAGIENRFVEWTPEASYGFIELQAENLSQQTLQEAFRTAQDRVSRATNEHQLQVIMIVGSPDTPQTLQISDWSDTVEIGDSTYHTAFSVSPKTKLLALDGGFTFQPDFSGHDRMILFNVSGSPASFRQYHTNGKSFHSGIEGVTITPKGNGTAKEVHSIFVVGEPGIFEIIEVTSQNETPSITTSQFATLNGQDAFMRSTRLVNYSLPVTIANGALTVGTDYTGRSGPSSILIDSHSGDIGVLCANATCNFTSPSEIGGYPNSIYTIATTNMTMRLKGLTVYPRPEAEKPFLDALVTLQASRDGRVTIDLDTAKTQLGPQFTGELKTVVRVIDEQVALCSLTILDTNSSYLIDRGDEAAVTSDESALYRFALPSGTAIEDRQFEVSASTITYYGNGPFVVTDSQGTVHFERQQMNDAGYTVFHAPTTLVTQVEQITAAQADLDTAIAALLPIFKQIVADSTYVSYPIDMSIEEMEIVEEQLFSRLLTLAGIKVTEQTQHTVHELLKNN